MKARLLLVFVTATLAASRVFGSSPPGNTYTNCKRWGATHESFLNGDWRLRHEGPRFAGQDDPRTLEIESTRIKITPFKKGGVIHTGSVSTEGRFALHEGTLRVVAKSCLVSPLRSAIWLQSPSNKMLDDGLPDIGAEIDVIEIIGRGRYISHNLHFGGYGKGHQTRGKRVNVDETCVSHEYMARFDGQGYAFFIDGKLSWHDTQPHRGAAESIILSVEFDVPKNRLQAIKDDGPLGYFEITEVDACRKATR